MAPPQQKKQQEASEFRYRLFPSTRLLVAMVAGIGAGIIMICRYNVSMAMVCMVDDTVSSQMLDTNITKSDSPTSISFHRTLGFESLNSSNVSIAGAKQARGPEEVSELEPKHEKRGEFQWDKTFQGLLLSSYFYGYTASQVFGGWISDKLPANLVFIFGVGSQAVFIFLFPLVARTSTYLLLALRALQGLSCSVVLPVSTVLIRNWSVPDEYSTLFAVAWALNYFVSGLTYPISSALCQAGGWPMVFYVTGTLPLLCVVVAWFCVPSGPSDSSICSQEEKRYICSRQLCRVATIESFKSSLKSKKLTSSSPDAESKPSTPTPFLAICFNPQVMIMVGCNFTFNWFYYSLNITMPSFLEETMGVDLTENGLLSGLPTLAMTLGVLFGGRLLQHLLTSWRLSRTRARKLIATVSLLTPAALLAAITLLPPGSKYATVALLTASNLIGVLVVSGGPVSAGPEIGPQFAGVLWGLSGSIGNMSGFIAPTLAAAMTPDKTPRQWRAFFLISVAMLVAMNVVILLFWRSEVQPFAKTEQENLEADKDEGKKDTAHSV